MELLYHYTTVDIFDKMFANYTPTNQFLTFWATHHRYMNDENEFQLGFDALLLFLERIEEEEKIPSEYQLYKIIQRYPQHIIELFARYKDKPTERLNPRFALQNQSYIISFSQMKDNIPMWYIYGNKGHGISLGFDKELLGKNSDYKEPQNDFFKGIELNKCIYFDRENHTLSEESYFITKEWYKKLTNIDVIKSFNKLYENTGRKIQDFNLYEGTFDALFLNLIQFIGSIIKNSDWSFEKEYRFNITNTSVNAIKYRQSDKLGHVPYLEIYIGIDALKEIIIGPTEDYSIARKKIKSTLDRYLIDTNNIDIRESKLFMRET